HHAIERVQFNQRHLLDLINQILDLGRVRSGETHFDLGAVAIDEVVRGAIEMIEPEARKKRLRYASERCEAGGTRGRGAHACPRRLRQILVNLLGNAVKYTPEGGSVTVACEGDNGTVAIHVRDTGEGIPADAQEAIFEPFVQVGRTLANLRQGS